MSDHTHHSGSNFMNGLVWGALLGASAIYLLQTKRGKELLDELSQKGFELLDEIDNLFGEIEETAEDIAPDLPIEPASLPLSNTPTITSEPVARLEPMKPATMPPPMATAQMQTPAQTAEFMQEVSQTSGNDNPLTVHVRTIQAQQHRRLFHGIPKKR